MSEGFIDDAQRAYDDVIAEYTGGASVEVPEPPRDDPVDERIVNEEAAADFNDSLEWARDVFWASRHMGQRPTKEKAGGGGFRFHMWEYARKNTKEFVGQVMPKAMAILDRANAKATANSETIEREERKGISDYQSMLRQAVKESQAA